MTPAKRGAATPASQGPTRTAPDVPVAAEPPPLPTKDGTELLGPDGAPIAQEAATGDARQASAPPTEIRQVDPEDRATKPSPRRSRALPSERVWPD
jgi:hypothetical protein